VHKKCVRWYNLTPMVLYDSKDRRAVHQQSQIRLFKITTHILQTISEYQTSHHK